MADFTEKELEYLRGISLLVATPCYAELCSSHYMMSILGLGRLCQELGIPFGIDTIGNQSLITRARNDLVSDFLETGYSHLMFIDADISFEPEDVLRLALHDRDVVVAAYPLKGLDWDRAATQKTGPAANKASINYVINLTPEQTEKSKENDGVLIVNLHNGLLEVYDAGTGFMMIRRPVIDKMIEAYGDDVMYKGDTTSIGTDGLPVRHERTQYALFDTSIDPETDRYLSEDYTFCRRWQSLEGKVWCDPTVILNHHGSYTYRGYNFMLSDK